MLSISYVGIAEPLLKAGSLINHLPAPGTAWDAADSIFISFAEINWGICSSPRCLLHAAGKTGSRQHAQKTKGMLCSEEIRTEIAP